MSKAINRRLSKLEGVLELPSTKGLDNLSNTEIMERIRQVCERLRSLFGHDIEVRARIKEFEESLTLGRPRFDFQELCDLMLSKVGESR